MLTDHKFITLSEKTQSPVHLISEKSVGKLATLFSHTRMSSQDTFSDRDGISSGHQTVQGEVNLSSRSLIWTKLREQFLKRDHQFAEAKARM